MEKDATLELYLDGYGKVDPLATPRLKEPKVERKARNSNFDWGPMDPMAQFDKMMMEMKKTRETIFQKLENLEKLKSQIFQPRNYAEGNQFKRDP